MCFCFVYDFLFCGLDKGGDKLTLPVSESDRASASSSPSGVDVVTPHLATSSPVSNGGAISEQKCPSSPVTMTYFQQSENGDLERKTVPEAANNNPFSSPSPASCSAAPSSSKNPFLNEEHCSSSNPFLLRLASPVLNRSSSPFPVVSDVPPLSVDVSDSVTISLTYELLALFYSCFLDGNFVSYIAQLEPKQTKKKAYIPLFIKGFVKRSQTPR